MKSQELLLNLQELKAYCQSLSNQITTPLIITLEGELGTGKTQFTHFLVSNLTSKSEVHSPTFTLINEYVGTSFPIYHVDLYRLKNSQDLDSSGFWDLFEEKALIFIEWSNLLDEKYIPKNCPRWHIKLEHTEELNVRKIKFQKLN
ncbi:MAG: tRNA (adenosine(37)-N6)-threonylcarbamoyltransferase complex ATPase subunit type 1 TsaE [Bdellovibrionaceae bacterium]|nr:tRNA (adenosine(37)-N6)-threonylcarbamoyltransferase complex ATPase subunit type 1 TsaE [Pseudobdellovibrionaceae bacterium]